jgi:hypothetical protein
MTTTQVLAPTSADHSISPHIHARLEKIGVWLLVPVGIAFGIGWCVIAGFLPPPSPHKSATEIAELYASRTTRIRIGVGLVLFTSVLMVPFIAVLVRHVRRVEGRWGVLSLSQLGTGLLLPYLVWLPCMFAEVAAFRPERSPELTQALNDMYWLWALGLVGGVIVQAPLLAVAAFVDPRPEPIFPRWFGYLNLWYAVLAVPGGTIVFFHDGPLAWNGVIGFWVPVVAFFIWIVGVAVVLLRAIDRELAEVSPLHNAVDMRSV